MEKINLSYLNKIRPAAEKVAGMPRCTRDEQLDIFLARLNASRIKDHYKKLDHPRVAKMLEGVPTDRLYALFQKCETYRQFGSGLKDQLEKGGWRPPRKA